MAESELVISHLLVAGYKLLNGTYLLRGSSVGVIIYNIKSGLAIPVMTGAVEATSIQTKST